MVTYLLYVVAALYLGVLTSISPCPLATNIAAISYIGRKVESPRLVINAGLLYTLGRCLLYLALAGLLTTTALSIPAVSLFLQKYMHLALGPIFLLLGMFLVGLVTVTAGATMMSEGMQKRVDAMGIWGALLLGILFAVSFCPTSAAWFFGLLALTMGSEAGAITTVLGNVGIALPPASVPGGTLLLPLIYGVGTALPVIVVAFLLAYVPAFVFVYFFGPRGYMDLGLMTVPPLIASSLLVVGVIVTWVWARRRGDAWFGT